MLLELDNNNFFAENKEKVVNSSRIHDFLVEISGIEPPASGNAIDGRSRVHQGQALQKEKPLKYKDFLRIRFFHALYFSASCALDF